MVSSLLYAKPERISLRGHPSFNERWLQDRIADDPSLIGLGQLVLLDRERVQDRAGRLDLLLADDEDRRYEVELQLGQTDETHIIRCIEYWDIERRRYPQYDHCAVLVAEDITSRFLNVIGLFNGQIPMIAISLNALAVGGNIVLDFVRVMDRFSLRRDEETVPPSTPANREYWEQLATPKTVAIADECVSLLNECLDGQRFQLTYNRYYMGLRDEVRTTAFIQFKAKRQFTHLWVSIDSPDDWVTTLEEAGIEASIKRGGYVQVTLRPGDVPTHRGVLSEVFKVAVSEYDNN